MDPTYKNQDNSIFLLEYVNSQIQSDIKAKISSNGQSCKNEKKIENTQTGFNYISQEMSQDNYIRKNGKWSPEEVFLKH